MNISLNIYSCVSPPLLSREGFGDRAGIEDRKRAAWGIWRHFWLITQNILSFNTNESMERLSIVTVIFLRELLSFVQSIERSGEDDKMRKGGMLIT